MIEQKYSLPLVFEFFSFMLSNSQGYRYGVGAICAGRDVRQTVNWQLYSTTLSALLRNCSISLFSKHPCESGCTILI